MLAATFAAVALPVATNSGAGRLGGRQGLVNLDGLLLVVNNLEEQLALLNDAIVSSNAATSSRSVAAGLRQKSLMCTTKTRG